MKNWKKLLACLLVGLMALTVFTACDASVGAPMEAKSSNAKSAEALCDKFKMTYNVEMTYNEDLSEKAYSIANWVVSSSVSCKVYPNKPELYRYDNVDDVAKTYLKQGSYAYAFDSMGIGKGIGGGMGIGGRPIGITYSEGQCVWDDGLRRTFMGFDKDICQKMYIAGALHDIGKVAIGNEILEKPEKLTDEEFKTMKHHAVL